MLGYTLKQGAYRSSETIFSQRHSVDITILKLLWVSVGSSRSVILWCEKEFDFTMEKREKKTHEIILKRNLKVLKLNWKYMFYLLK